MNTYEMVKKAGYDVEIKKHSYKTFKMHLKKDNKRTGYFVFFDEILLTSSSLQGKISDGSYIEYASLVRAIDKVFEIIAKHIENGDYIEEEEIKKLTLSNNEKIDSFVDEKKDCKIYFIYNGRYTEVQYFENDLSNGYIISLNTDLYVEIKAEKVKFIYRNGFFKDAHVIEYHDLKRVINFENHSVEIDLGASGCITLATELEDWYDEVA